MFDFQTNMKGMGGSQDLSTQGYDGVYRNVLSSLL